MLKLLSGPTRWGLSARGRELADIGDPQADSSAAPKRYVDKWRTYLSRFADTAGEEDIAPALLAAVAAAVPIAIFATPLREVHVDRGQYRVGSTIDLTGQNVRLIGAGGTLVPDLRDAQGNPVAGNVFKTNSGIIEVIGVEFDGGDNQPTNALTNTRVLLIGSGVPNSVSRAIVRGCRFKNLLAVGSPDRTANLLVTHAIYIQGVTEAIVEGNFCDGVSGAATFYKNVTRLVERGNHWKGTQWYCSQINEGVVNALIEGNFYDCSDPYGIYKGGAVNTVSDYGLQQNSNITIRNNFFSGYYRYGAVIRSQSDKGVTIEGNVFGVCQLGSGEVPGSQFALIRVSTRGHLDQNPTSSDPEQSIIIRGNRAMFGVPQDYVVPSARMFIYVTNDWDTSRNPVIGVIIEGNTCRSPSADSYITHGITVNGVLGGMEDVRIFDNDCEVRLNSSTPAVGGLSVNASSAQGLVDGVQFGGNRVTNLEPAVGSTQVCIQISASVTNVRNVRPNKLISGFYGVRVSAGAGPTLEGLDDQRFVNCTTNMLFNQALSRYAVPLLASVTYDPPSLASAATTTVDTTITGAAIGDAVDATFSLDQANLSFHAYVRVAGSVRTLVTNRSGATVDLASGTLYNTVRRRPLS
ncbi:MAG: hypothetical protein ACM3ZV_07420 [Bacillota bacterium]